MAENALSIFQCGFRKKCSTQHALIVMIEKAKKILDKGGIFGINIDVCLSDRKETKSQNKLQF